MKVVIVGKCKWFDDVLDVLDVFLRIFYIGIYMGIWCYVFYIVKKIFFIY